jgi:hypothetical protein
MKYIKYILATLGLFTMGFGLYHNMNQPKWSEPFLNSYIQECSDKQISMVSYMSGVSLDSDKPEELSYVQNISKEYCTCESLALMDEDIFPAEQVSRAPASTIEANANKGYNEWRKSEHGKKTLKNCLESAKSKIPKPEVSVSSAE